MTIEEKARLMKELGVDMGKTEIVFEKNVEYEIGNVEAGGIGVQIINEAKPGTAKKTNGRKTDSDTPKIVDDVFTYRYLDREDGYRRLTLLYQLLLKAQPTSWIDPKTKAEDFCAIFSGEPTTAKVKWMAHQSDLYLLISTLIKQKLITFNKTIGQWVITGSHFLDAESHQFKDWNSQKAPKKTSDMIETFCSVLDPKMPIERRRSSTRDDD